MRRLRTICVGINFSPESEIALRCAATLASSFGAALELCAVVEPLTLYQRVVSPIQSRLISTAERVTQTQQRLRQLADAAFLAALRVECVARVGVAFVELIRRARDAQADLLVVGARPRGKLERALLGGTAERVVRKAPIPVLVAPSALPPAPASLLAPTDFSPASRPALEEAIALARRWGARLTLLHVVEPIVQMYVWPAEPAMEELYPVEPAELEPEWEALLADLELRDVSWEKRTVKGTAAAAILEAATELPADLIVMGTHGRSGLAHALLGSVAERVAREAGCPLLSVRPEAQQFVLP